MLDTTWEISAIDWLRIEQWYFSLIWNTDMWKLQTFAGSSIKQIIAWFVVIFGIYKITKMIYAFWLVKNLWFIVAVNSYET